MCMYDGGEGNCEFHSEVIRKARKRHKCVECKRFIEPGENYERVVGKWNGDISTFLTCIHCVGARAWLEIECGGWLYSTIKEDLEEHVSELDSDLSRRRLMRLIVGIRNGWKQFFGTGLMPVPVVKEI